MTAPIVHIVHCIDTEGPLDEDLAATFQRLGALFDIRIKPTRGNLKKLQNREIDLGGVESEVAKVVSPDLLNYNRNWQDVRAMLDDALGPAFRNEMLDDAGNGWVYSWHCVDHLGLRDNPRHKDLGYGNVFRYYRDILDETDSSRDELNWHFHPLSLTREPLSAATSYYNNLDILLPVIARRVIEDRWFPTTNRPGFHAERPDCNAFLEQWIPFDYANQALIEAESMQKDTLAGRFGDWRRAPQTWQGYHPHHDDHQSPGSCRRWIFRCLNIGTRFRLLTIDHLREAFREACEHGSAIVAFADHDYRDIRPDVRYLRDLLAQVRDEFGDVEIRFSGAEQAARAHVAITEPELDQESPSFGLKLEDNRLHVELESGSLFGPQPFLAIKSRQGIYYHDNLDEITANHHWSYVFDEQTLPPDTIEIIGIGGSGRCGRFGVASIEP